jgi:hypothetical protein
MPRKIDHYHPELPTIRPRWTRPAPPHDPAYKVIFSPSGAFLGFAAPATSPASIEAEPTTTEME